eukprot:339629_1
MADWACSVCSFINNNNRAACEICETPKSNEPPKQSVEEDYELAKALQAQYLETDRKSTPSGDNKSKSVFEKIEMKSNSNSNTNTTSTEPVYRKDRKRKRHEMNTSENDDDEEWKDNEENDKYNHNIASQIKLKEQLVGYSYRSQDIIKKIANNWVPGTGVNDKFTNAYLLNKIDLIASKLSNHCINPIESIISASRVYKQNKQILRYSDNGIEIIGNGSNNNYAYLIIDFKDIQVAVSTLTITQPLACRAYIWNQTTQAYVPGIDRIVQLRLDGSNDKINWHFIGKCAPNCSEYFTFFGRSKWEDRIYYTKFRIMLAVPNSSRNTNLKIKKIEFYGNIRRKVYKINRIGELIDFEVFPKIPTNRCIGDPNSVCKILDEYNDLKHINYDKYNDNIQNLTIELKDYQKQGVQWLIDMENNGNEMDIKGGLLCDEMGLGKTVQIIALMLIQRAKKRK